MDYPYKKVHSKNFGERCIDLRPRSEFYLSIVLTSGVSLEKVT